MSQERLQELQKDIDKAYDLLVGAAMERIGPIREDLNEEAIRVSVRTVIAEEVTASLKVIIKEFKSITETDV